MHNTSDIFASLINWINQSTVNGVELNDEMIRAKKSWVINQGKVEFNE